MKKGRRRVEAKRLEREPEAPWNGSEHPLLGGGRASSPPPAAGVGGGVSRRTTDEEAETAAEIPGSVTGVHSLAVLVREQDMIII